MYLMLLFGFSISFYLQSNKKRLEKESIRKFKKKEKFKNNYIRNAIDVNEKTINRLIGKKKELEN